MISTNSHRPNSDTSAVVKVCIEASVGGRCGREYDQHPAKDFLQFTSKMVYSDVIYATLALKFVALALLENSKASDDATGPGSSRLMFGA